MNIFPKYTTVCVVIFFSWLGFPGPGSNLTYAQPTDSGPSTDRLARPNVLLLLSDDQRSDTIAALGNSIIKTPALDQLAGRSLVFRNAYCFGSPHGAVCVPSRAMLHSGRSLFFLPDLNLAGSQTLGEILSANGYRTFATGKWHNGQESFVRSFQAAENIMFGGMSNHSEVPLVQLDSLTRQFSSPETGDCFSSKLFADSAIEFLHQQSDQTEPFFCYVAFTAPHDPRMSPGNFNRMYRPEEMPVPINFLPQHPFNNGELTVRDECLAGWPRTREVIQAQTADYYGLISHLDQQIGRILATLDGCQLRENTIVIFASDHGLALGSHGLLGKQNLYEHSTRLPLLVSGPGIKPGASDALVYLHDLFPTILDTCGVAQPPAGEAQSLSSLIYGRPGKTRDLMFTAYRDTMRAIRDQRWKLIRYPRINRNQLFDLQTDPHELQDLSQSADPLHRQALQRLLDQLRAQQILHGDRSPLEIAEPETGEIDLTGHPRTPDPWQPRWIVEKYFNH
jgi:arylsulfatase A-like enzyme